MSERSCSARGPRVEGGEGAEETQRGCGCRVPTGPVQGSVDVRVPQPRAQGSGRRWRPVGHRLRQEPRPVFELARDLLTRESEAQTCAPVLRALRTLEAGRGGGGAQSLRSGAPGWPAGQAGSCLSSRGVYCLDGGHGVGGRRRGSVSVQIQGPLSSPHCAAWSPQQNPENPRPPYKQEGPSGSALPRLADQAGGDVLTPGGPWGTAKEVGLRTARRPRGITAGAGQGGRRERPFWETNADVPPGGVATPATPIRMGRHASTAPLRQIIRE